MLDAIFSIAVWFFALSGFAAWSLVAFLTWFYWLTRRK